MTRNKQILSEVQKRFSSNDTHLVSKISTFIDGAKWADEHPKDGFVNLDKVCEWLENKCENKREYIGGIFGGPCSISIIFENISKDLRKAMENDTEN